MPRTHLTTHFDFILEVSLHKRALTSLHLNILSRNLIKLMLFLEFFFPLKYFINLCAELRHFDDQLLLRVLLVLKPLQIDIFKLSLFSKIVQQDIQLFLIFLLLHNIMRAYFAHTHLWFSRNLFLSFDHHITIFFVYF